MSDYDFLGGGDAPAPAGGPPPHLAEAWRITNEGRRREGLPEFAWDDRLARAAQLLCDWAWETYAAGGDVTSDPHHDFLERQKAVGWPSSMTRPRDARGGIGNFSECGSTGQGGGARGRDGKTWPPDPSGWSYPPRDPEEMARENVWMLTEGIKDPNEGHRKDFHTGWTHAGLGHREGMFVLTYGYLP